MYKSGYVTLPSSKKQKSEIRREIRKPSRRQNVLKAGINPDGIRFIFVTLWDMWVEDFLQGTPLPELEGWAIPDPKEKKTAKSTSKEPKPTRGRPRRKP